MSLGEARARARALGDLVREGIDPKAKERQDAEEARRAAERETRRGSLAQLLTAYVEWLRAQGKVSARGVEALFHRAVVRPFPALVARKAADIGPRRIFNRSSPACSPAASPAT
jgi:hypothetical protein